MVRLLPLVVLLAGCEASLAGGGNNTTPDARTGGGGSDSGTSTDAAIATPDSAAPACANGRRVFLNFDGVNVTQGSPSDSTQNRVSWMSNANATVPPWRQGSGTRAAEIVQVTDGVRARLSTTPIEVVTTRPAAAPYVMIVFGGTNSNIGTIYSFATSFHDCGDNVKNDVGWVSDMAGQSTEYVADIAVGAIGWSLGLDGTNVTDGCMCGWANGCTNAAGACTLSANIATQITNGVESACTAGSQNEVAAFSTGFCQ